jgi:hypothetical protein
LSRGGRRRRRRRWQLLEIVDDTRPKLVGRKMCQWSDNGAVRCVASRYLGFPRGRKELDSGTPLPFPLQPSPLPPPPFLTAHPSPDCAGIDCERGEKADHESSAGLLLANSAHGLVALSGCDVSTCCTQRISKDNDAPQVTRRALNQPDPVRICIEVPTIGSTVARAGRVQVGARWSFARSFVTRLRGLKVEQDI